MSRRTTQAYDCVWKFIKQEFKDFNPKSSMTDFELALMNSIAKAFPGIRVTGCHFHFSQVCLTQNFLNYIHNNYYLDFYNKQYD